MSLILSIRFIDECITLFKPCYRFNLELIDKLLRYYNVNTTRDRTNTVADTEHNLQVYTRTLVLF